MSIVKRISRGILYVSVFSILLMVEGIYAKVVGGLPQPEHVDVVFWVEFTLSFLNILIAVLSEKEFSGFD